MWACLDAHEAEVLGGIDKNTGALNAFQRCYCRNSFHEKPSEAHPGGVCAKKNKKPTGFNWLADFDRKASGFSCGQAQKSELDYLRWLTEVKC